MGKQEDTVDDNGHGQAHEGEKQCQALGEGGGGAGGRGERSAKRHKTRIDGKNAVDFDVDVGDVSTPASDRGASSLRPHALVA